MSSSQGGDQPGKGVKGMFGRLKNGCRLGDRKKGYEKVIRVNLDRTSWDVVGMAVQPLSVSIWQG